MKGNQEIYLYSFGVEILWKETTFSKISVCWFLFQALLCMITKSEPLLLLRLKLTWAGLTFRLYSKFYSLDVLYYIFVLNVNS